MAVWPQVHGESWRPVSQLCLPALPAQPRVCAPGFRHTLGSSARRGSLLPALLFLGRSEPQRGGGGPRSWPAAPQPHPRTASDFVPLGKLLSSAI